MIKTDRQIGPEFNPLYLVKDVIHPEPNRLQGHVPLQFVHTGDVAVDTDHVNALAKSIREEEEKGAISGQITPTFLGQTDGSPYFTNIDGFHRTAALRKLGKKSVWSTIRLHCSEREILDFRILMATIHESVQFPRIIDWIHQVWEMSEWAGRLEPLQAFNLRIAPAMTGQRLGLHLDEAQQVREWVDESCARWQLQPSTIFEHLVTAKSADRELVRSVRERKGSNNSDDGLTPSHLKVIVKALPNKFEQQRLVAQVITRHSLTVDATHALAVGVSRTKTPQDAKTFIDSGTWIVAFSEKPSLPTTVKRYVVESSPQLQIDKTMQPYVHALTKLGYAANTQEAVDIIKGVLEMFKNIPIIPVKKDQAIIDEGYFAGKLAIIGTGYAFISYSDSYGYQATTQIAGPLSVLASEVLHGAPTYQNTAQAITDCSVLYLNPKDIVSAIKQDRSVAMFFVVAQSLAEHQQNTRMNDWATKEAKQCVAGEILNIIEYPEILPFVSQEDVAQLAGCSRESSNKAIRSFEKQGFLYWDNALGPQLVDREKLRQIYNQERYSRES